MGYGQTTPECFVFNDGNSTNSGILAMLPALLQRQGVDPGLIAMCSKRDNGWSDILGLIVILAILGNNGFGFGGRGFGGGSLPGIINNDANTQVLMNMLQRNGVDIQSLANMSKTSSDAVIAAINMVGKDICSQGINTMQSFNAVQTQLANCCCTLRDAITNQGYQSQLGQKDIQNGMTSGFGNIQVGMERGFSQLGYATQDQTNAIKQAIDANGDRMLARMEMYDKERMQREINALTAENATIKARAERAAEKADTDRRIDAIACKIPNTVPVQWPQLEVYQRNAYADYGRFGGNFG